jgi:hypothetical protein
MMKKHILKAAVLAALFLVGKVGVVNAQQVLAQDKASNYTGSALVNLENRGSGFGAWYSVVEGADASIGVASASANGANSAAIDTDGTSFALTSSLAANRNQKAELGRLFQSALADGNEVVFTFAWNWGEGLKGFALHNGSWETASAGLQIDFANDGYFVNGEKAADPATNDDWNSGDKWRAGGVAFRVNVKKTGEDLAYEVKAITERSVTSFSGTAKGVSADRIRFFCTDSPSWNSGGQGGLYFNSLELIQGPTTSAENTFAAKKFYLEQNYPNPFNPGTVIRYTLDKTSRMSLTVVNMLGQEVAVLERGQKTAGNHSVSFNASYLPSGMYLYRLETEAGTITRKMMLVK